VLGIYQACARLPRGRRHRFTGIYPPLPGNANLQSTDPSSTLRIILDGALTVDDAAGAERRLDAGLCQEVAGSGDRRRATYIRNSWGNAAPVVTPEQWRRRGVKKYPGNPL